MLDSSWFWEAVGVPPGYNLCELESFRPNSESIVMVGRLQTIFGCFIFKLFLYASMHIRVSVPLEEKKKDAVDFKFFPAIILLAEQGSST
jgi:hypothetical protein